MSASASVAATFRTTRRALRLVREGSGPQAALVLVFQLVSTAAMLGALVLGGRLVEQLTLDSPALRPAMTTGLLLAAAGATSALSGAIAKEVRDLQAELLARHAMERVISAAIVEPLKRFDDPEWHDKLHRVVAHGLARPYQLASGATSMIGATLGLTGIAVVLARIHPSLLALVVFGLPALVVVALRNDRERFQFTYWMSADDRRRQYLSDVLTSRASAAELRILGSGRHLMNQYSELYDRRVDALVQLVRQRSIRAMFAGLFSGVMFAAVLGLLIKLRSDNSITASDVAVGALGLQQAGVRMRTLSSAIGNFGESALFVEDYLTLVGHEPQRASSDALGGCEVVELDAVSFSYPGTSVEVLHDITMSVKRGEIVAIVGENGSGKSTVTRLLAGLYGPTAGRVRWNGVDLPPEAMPAIWRHVGATMQDAIRFELPAQDNIGLGDPQRIGDLPEVRAAAEMAAIDDVLDHLPAGYDTVLSRAFLGGAELSVGQWQRVALARALFAQPSLLLLDEPTSALDPTAEQHIVQNLRTWASDAAVVLVSHRYSTVIGADRIYVMESGRVVEHGTHAELCARGGRYAEAYRAQAEPFRRADPIEDGRGR